MEPDALRGAGRPPPQGFDAPFDAVVALIAVGAAGVPFRFKAGEVPFLTACALPGRGISLMWRAPSRLDAEVP
ncbi:hypothetical protein [Azohydromonas australica]|uniref:hypothetical protein n=1 Tax=Azohydromonas australica TaxID=364039 RepID=UPI00048A4C0A|nr:hypothetical protein [Azohydromonas australica]